MSQPTAHPRIGFRGLALERAPELTCEQANAGNLRSGFVVRYPNGQLCTGGRSARQAWQKAYHVVTGQWWMLRPVGAAR